MVVAIVGVAQFTSVLVSGLTGVLSPLVSTLFRDSGKWGGLMETAFQDIVSCLAMVGASYVLLLYWWTGTDDNFENFEMMCGYTTVTTSTR